jgi:NAD(P)-dependent dehydrogenase (short-subunit alcohol dehydrogenase family)
MVSAPKVLAYSASKGGVRAMTKSMALDLADRETGIRVNSIHPGFADTPLVENAIAALEPEEGEQFSAQIAERAKLGLANPDQIAAAAVFLFSDDSSFMTGSELVVDGGYTAS